MDYLSIILIAVGLAMDCFAVSLSKGLQAGKTPDWAKAMLMAVLFGLFQGAMPLLSFYAGNIFNDFFHTFSHWIALVLLSFIGGKMIYESLKTQNEQSDNPPTRQFTDSPIIEILLLSIATSIDAFVTGVLFIPVPDKMLPAALIIALVSFMFSIGGYCIGVFVGKRFRFNAELLGGIILVGIGVKIFIEHLLS